MFTRLYELSRLLGIEKRPAWELLNHGMPENYRCGFAICFDDRGNYVGVRTISGHRGVGDRGVVYRPGPGSNSPPLVPCSRLSQKLATNIKYLFLTTSQVGQSDDLPEAWKKWFANIDWQDKDLQRRVIAETIGAMADSKVGEKLAGGRTRSGYWFPARYVGPDDIRPVYELKAAKKLMVEKAVSVWQTYSNKKVARTGTCSVCGRQKQEVFGNFSELKCYILDKPGLIAGGFGLEAAARNFPVCRQCSFALAFTIDYVMRRLKARMAGADYFVLPYSTAPEEIRQVLRDKLAENPQRLAIDKDDCDLLVDLEENLLDLIRDEDLNEQLAFSLVFFREKQKEWKIVAEVQQVLPGRMKQIWRARRLIARDALVARAGKKGAPVNISAYVVSRFCGNRVNSRAASRTFYQWMEAIFGAGGIDRRRLIRNIARGLLATAKSEPKLLAARAAEAWALYLFCNHLNLVRQEENTIMTFQDTVYGRYIRQHPGFFSRQETAAAFLTGCYVDTVCSYQKKMRGLKPGDQAPFAKKFQGRLLSAALLKRLFQQGHDKLAQYDGLGLVIYDRLEEELARAWVECEDKWAITDEEATFAFTIGFCLGRFLRPEKKSQQGEEAA